MEHSNAYLRPSVVPSATPPSNFVRGKMHKVRATHPACGGSAGGSLRRRKKKKSVANGGKRSSSALKAANPFHPQRVISPPPGFAHLYHSSFSSSSSINSLSTNAAWTPPHKESSLTSPVSESKRTVKALKSLLNKVTEENFDKMQTELVAIGSANKEDLEELVSAIIDKAITERMYTALYGRLCAALEGALPSLSPERCINLSEFSEILLNKCQVEFERLEKDNTHPKEFICKKREGFAVFMGELYNAGIMPEEVIHICISQWLANSQVSIVCTILHVVGRSLDAHPTSRVLLDEFVTQLHIIVANTSSLSPRHRFSLQDLVDRRSAGWP